ncbi:MAG: GNAT family N-acetyltransferase [Halanaeroarchaeum sp.]
MPGPVFRSGDDVDLCPVEEEDLPFLVRNWNAPDVRRWMPAAEPTSSADLEEKLEEWRDDEETTRLLACVDGEAVGSISLFHVEERSGNAFVGAFVDPDYQGNGYGRAMTAQMVDYAFNERRLHRLTAHALATNERSRATLESVGFEREGCQRDGYFVDGEYVDRVTYGLLADDWDALD